MNEHNIVPIYIYKIDDCHIVKSIYYKVTNTHTNFRLTFAYNYI